MLLQLGDVRRCDRVRLEGQLAREGERGALGGWEAGPVAVECRDLVIG
jgi:hypothetical protein